MSKITKVLQKKKSEKPADVCVLLTSYNYESFVIEALDSIRNQSFESLDIVVIDDCSTDNSQEKISAWFEQYGDRFNSYAVLRNLSNQGVVFSRNAALRHVDSEFVFMLDADNIAYPSCIQKLFNALHVSGKEFAYPILERFDKETRLINLTPWNPKLFYLGNAIDNMALYKKSAILAVDGYSPDMKGTGWEDFELFIKFAQKGFSGCHVPEILARYRVHGMSSVTDIAILNNESRWKYLREKHAQFFAEVSQNNEIENEKVVLSGTRKQSFADRAKWALHNPLKFSKKYIWKKTPQYSQIRWALTNPDLFAKKYFLKRRHKVAPSTMPHVENAPLQEKALRTVYYISNVMEGGSRKYILDLMDAFENSNLKFVQIRNKHDIELYKNEFKKDDILLFQYLFFSDFTLEDIVDIKKNYNFKLIVPVHDFYFLGQLSENFYEFNVAVHSNYLTVTKLRDDVIGLLNEASVVIYPSEFVKNVFDALHVFEHAVLSRHIDYTVHDFWNIPVISDHINVAIINNITIYKGDGEYPKLFNVKKYKNHTIRYHVFGEYRVESSNVVFHGPYKENEIFSLLKKHNIHALAFLNEFGETYSYSLTKGINSGLPILYSNIGAYVERLKNNPRFFPIHDKDKIEIDLNKMLRVIIEKQGISIGTKPEKLEKTVPDVYKKIFFINYELILSHMYAKNTLAYKKLSTVVEPYAIYFPQFHALKENSKTFYEGYHDMINLEDAKKVDSRIETPLKNYLGYYNLKTTQDIIEKQIFIAKSYGFRGFGIYYYWFSQNSVTGNHMLMKDVVDRFFKEKTDGFDVFFIYANESWSNNPAFNQHSNEYIIRNEYDEENIRKNFENLLPYFKHENYKKIENKPVLFLHHPWEMTKGEFDRFSLIGNIVLKKNGFSGIELVVNAMHGRYDGYHNYSHHPDYKNTNVFMSNENGGKYIDYRKYVDEYLPRVQHSLSDIRTVFYNFDNSVRYLNHQNKNILITKTKNNTLEYFRKFLYSEMHGYFQREKKNKILLINSWNEWGEQMAMEPSNESGFKLLDVFQKTVVESCWKYGNRKHKILYVGHDAGYYGAQLLSLYIIKELKQRFNFDVSMIIKAGGPLENEYRKYATVYNFSDPEYTQNKKEELLHSMHKDGIAYAIINTVICGDILGMAHDAGMKTLSLVHELPGVIEQFNVLNNAKTIIEKADHVIFPSSFVKDKFSTLVPLQKNNISVRPQGLIRQNPYKHTKDTARTLLRKSLGIPEGAFVVLGVGSGNLRKGIDHFFEVAQKTKDSRIYFVWVGTIDIEIKDQLFSKIKKWDNIRLIPDTEDISLYYAGSDLYLLTSREDPFPIVVMESMFVGVPVVAFDGAGGFVDIVTEEMGILVPLGNTAAMVLAIENLFKNPQILQQLGTNAQKLIEENFIFKDYMYDLLNQLGFSYKKVSAVVPNYNYGRYLTDRLNSIVFQSYPLYEIIVLDDASSDDSVEIIDEYIAHTEFKDIRKKVNDKNSGSVFRQWSVGIDEAMGDFIWMAEADDLSEPLFLENIMKGFDTQEVVISYCQSKTIDQNGERITDDYLDYLTDIDDEKWKTDYIVSGKKEIADVMVIKNSIPNVSSVVFKKISFDPDLFQKMATFSVAGDWYFYIWMLGRGDIAYTSKNLNIHRLNTLGVTRKTDQKKHFNEIVTIQNYAMSNYSVSDKTKKKMIDYRNKVKENFNLI